LTKVSVLWSAGTLAILVMAAVTWVNLPLPIPPRFVTPFDYTPTSSPQAWVFLFSAARCIAPNETVTVLAPTPEQEHELFVLAVATLDRNKPLAATYFAFPHPENVAAARYVLTFGEEAPAAMRGQLTELCGVPFGHVYERSRR
jgi:hypothetical protein